MKKYLVSIEFRYSKDDLYGSKEVIIGVYDDFEEACIGGNNLLINLESKFKLHTFPSGTVAKKDRFSKNGGCFGSKNTLVTNSAYLRTPFDFYAKITTLNYDNIDSSIEEAVNFFKK
tara:strand:+ start:562 stop:912 length:351 start_codon:yes stop_codon:yes gene_type:complete